MEWLHQRYENQSTKLFRKKPSTEPSNYHCMVKKNNSSNMRDHCIGMWIEWKKTLKLGAKRWLEKECSLCCEKKKHWKAFKIFWSDTQSFLNSRLIFDYTSVRRHDNHQLSCWAFFRTTMGQKEYFHSIFFFIKKLDETKWSN